MPRPRQVPDLDRQVLMLLAASAGGLKSPELRARIGGRISQPTLSRALTRLRVSGQVVASNAARARRYHLAGGRLGVADLRSRLLHEIVARRLLKDPGLRAAASARLKKLRRANPSGRVYHDRWAALLAEESKGVPARLLKMLTEDSEQAATLRRESPFTPLVPKAERARLFRQLRLGSG